MNHLKSPEITWISFRYNIFVFKNFHKVFVNIQGWKILKEKTQKIRERTNF